MEPTDNLSGGQSRSGEYGFPAGFMLSDSLQLPLPPAEGLAELENFDDLLISLDVMPCIHFGDVQISSLAEMPCIPAAVVAEESNYAVAPAPHVAAHGTGPASPIPGHQMPMEATDNLSGGQSCSVDYGFPAGFMLSDSLQLPLPPAEGLVALENFGDWQISLDVMPCIHSGDVQISPLAEMPCIPAAVAEETNYAVASAPLVATHDTGPASPIPGHQITMEPTDNLSAGQSRSMDYEFPAVFMLSDSLQLPLPPADGLAPSENFGDWPISLDVMPCIHFGDVQISPLAEMPCIPAAVAEETNSAAAPALLVAAHGTGPRQFSSNFSLSCTTSYECDEEDEVTAPWQLLLHQPMATDGFSDTTNGVPTARSHADAVPVVQQATSTTADELPRHPQEAQPGGGWAWLGLPQADEAQIQQMTPTTISPSQPPPPSPLIDLGLDEANHAASAPMGSQGTLIPVAPGEQEANILSRASTRSRAGLPNQLQDGLAMILQLGRLIGKMKKEEQRLSQVWEHFWRTPPCKYCGTVSVICPDCRTVMRDPSTVELLRHLVSIHPLRASSGARSSVQITEIIPENPNGESTEAIGTDNSNSCATAAPVNTQDTNAVVPSQWQQHQPLMDSEEQMATILSSHPCCKGPDQTWEVGLTEWVGLDEPEPWSDLVIRLSGASLITKSTHDGFRLKISNINKEACSKIVRVHSPAAWVDLRENPRYHGRAKVRLVTDSDSIGSSYLSVALTEYDWKSAPAGYEKPWTRLHMVLRSLGFRKEFARDLVVYTFGKVEECNLWTQNPSSSSSDKGKRKRQPLAPRSKVWNHFTKEVVEAQGSTVIMARCNHCGSKLTADSVTHGTRHLAGHIRSKHPDELAKSPI